MSALWRMVVDRTRYWGQILGHEPETLLSHAEEQMHAVTGTGRQNHVLLAIYPPDSHCQLLPNGLMGGG